MSDPDTDDSINITNEEKARYIEQLLVGPKADDFRKFESHTFTFCPFEAIGMVRQEIKHAHFLSFILDPNRPHPFQDHFLKTFLQEITARAETGQTDFRALDIHCADFGDAIIYRERQNIDLLIEIPANQRSTAQKGMIVAVEMKIDAAESEGQLKRYYEQVQAQYPVKHWNHTFVFLTLDATPPSGKNIDHWISVSLADLIGQLEQEADMRAYSGEATELFRKYVKMIRRHMMDDDELARLAKGIWAKHKEALETLYEHKPDLQGDLLEWIDANANEFLKPVLEHLELELEKDTPSRRIKRYSIKSWRDFDRFCDTNNKWTKSGSILLLELTGSKDGHLKFLFTLGPGDQDLKESLYQELPGSSIKIGEKTPKLTKWNSLSSIDLLTATEYSAAEREETDLEKLGIEIIGKMVSFLEKYLPIYDDVIQKLLGGDR